MDVHLFLDAGLGNQLFQLAAAYTYVKKHSYTLKIHNRGKRSYFGTFFLDPWIRYLANETSEQIAWPRDPPFAYSPIPHNTKYLKGFFQSRTYFIEEESDLKQLLAIPQTVHDQTDANYTVPSNAVAIHIRRGDYQDPFFRGMFDVCTPSYWKRAIERMRALHPNARFYVFSDDIEWCKVQPWLIAPDIIHVDEPSELITLCLMSRMRRFILSNSSFSWWATWYAKSVETVIVPSRWFNHTVYDYEDIYEPSWIRISPDTVE